MSLISGQYTSEAQYLSNICNEKSGTLHETFNLTQTSQTVWGVATDWCKAAQTSRVTRLVLKGQLSQVDRVLATPVIDLSGFHTNPTIKYPTAFKQSPLCFRLNQRDSGFREGGFGRIGWVIPRQTSAVVRVSGFITSVIAAGTGVLGVVFFCKSSF